MPWNEQWSYKVDGTELNDHVNFFCMIPELDSMQAQQIVLAPLAGDYPVFIRMQPMEGNLTFNIAMARGCTNTVWQQRLNTLRSLFTQGTRHQLTVQARGMTAAKSVYFYTDGGMMTDFKAKIVSLKATAPKPVLE